MFLVDLFETSVAFFLKLCSGGSGVPVLSD